MTLDDQAAVVLPDFHPLATGSYQPADYEPGDTFPAPAPAPTGTISVGTFSGANPNGTWSLYVADDTSGDPGSINGWDLQITTTGGPPPPPPRPHHLHLRRLLHLHHHHLRHRLHQYTLIAA